MGVSPEAHHDVLDVALVRVAVHYSHHFDFEAVYCLLTDRFVAHEVRCKLADEVDEALVELVAGQEQALYVLEDLAAVTTNLHLAVRLHKQRQRVEVSAKRLLYVFELEHVLLLLKHHSSHLLFVLHVVVAFSRVEPID